MSESLRGPGRSKESIIQFEDWLRVVCKTQKKVQEIEAQWQYLTGHEPRKTRQYLKAIQSQGEIRLFNNEGEQFCICVQSKPEAKLSKIGEDWFERCRIKDEMMAGPCKEECSAEDKDCRFCNVYTGLHRIFPLEGE
jgi:hypothetical protein